MQQFARIWVVLLVVSQPALAASSARDCPALAHQPDDSVAFKPDPHRPAEGQGALAVDPKLLDIPVVIDVLRGRAVAGRPLVGETAVARVTSGKDGWQVSSVTNPEKPALALERPCLPRIERPVIKAPRRPSP